MARVDLLFDDENVIISAGQDDVKVLVKMKNLDVKMKIPGDNFLKTWASFSKNLIINLSPTF